MEFCNPSDARTPEQYARMFCTMIKRVLDYACRNVADAHCAALLDAARAKYRAAFDFLLTREQITEKIGAILMRWEQPIVNYNIAFFLEHNIADLVAATELASDSPSEDPRARFYRATTPRAREVVLDALNNMLILYSRYQLAKMSATHPRADSR
jgi:hypothetical protein